MELDHLWQFIRLLLKTVEYIQIWLQVSRTLRTSLMRASWQTCVTKKNSQVQDERLELSMFSHSGLSRAPIPIWVIPEVICSSMIRTHPTRTQNPPHYLLCYGAVKEIRISERVLVGLEPTVP